MDLNALLGRTLTEATSGLDQEPIVVRTAPPFEPRFRKPVWGEWRVVRARYVDGAVELLVAQELLAEKLLDLPPGKRPARS